MSLQASKKRIDVRIGASWVVGRVNIRVRYGYESPFSFVFVVYSTFLVFIIDEEFFGFD